VKEQVELAKRADKAMTAAAKRAPCCIWKWFVAANLRLRTSIPSIDVDGMSLTQLGMAAVASGSSSAGGARRVVVASTTPAWRWIEAIRNPLAGVTGLRPNCMAVGDVVGDGTVQLIVACPDSTLRVLDGKSCSVVRTAKLLGEPTALSVFFPDTRTPRVPAVAIACGSTVYVYRNLRPFFKFRLPSLPLHETESSAWSSMLKGDMDPRE
jgi:hypothetical protein